MAHAHHKFRSAEARASIEQFIDQRNQRRDAFEREALAAKITLLHDLLKDVGPDEQVENSLLVFCGNVEFRRRRFHPLINPAPAFGSVDVIDLDADGRGINRASFASVLAFDL